MITVTVGIPAYNEEPNIRKHLESVVRQTGRGFRIEKIIVLSDGSTDGTVAEAKRVKDKRIRIINNKKRMGKSYHLNTFPKIVDSDVLVLFDADVILEGPDVIGKLIAPIRTNRHVGLVSGNFKPAEVRNFMQTANQCTINVFEVLRREWKGGHNAFGCTGRIMAMSKAFYKVLSVPPTMVLNDIYTYFDCMNHGFEFRHVRSVKVYYQLPTTIGDYLKQFKRFCVGSARMKKIFGSLYENEYAISRRRYYGLMFREFLKKPVHCLFIYGLNKAGALMARSEIGTMNGKWEVVTSTKRVGMSI